MRYRYRLYPPAGQQKALAQAFGCARVVYNDCLRVRDAAYANGEKISGTEVQRRVITLAKATPERAWLAKVGDIKVGWSQGSAVRPVVGHGDPRAGPGWPSRSPTPAGPS